VLLLQEQGRQQQRQQREQQEQVEALHKQLRDLTHANADYHHTIKVYAPKP
jgi:hypothetical protein